MDLNLGSRVFLITGGTDGLGLALAERLVAEGARVAICGRDSDRLSAARERVAAVDPDRVLARQADVTDAADLASFFDATIDRWGRLDGVVNNAGEASTGRFERLDDERWQHDLELKLLAAVCLLRMAIPHLRAVGGGSVVNVLNYMAKAPGARSMPTSVTRAAGLALTKALSREFGPDGIRVNAVLIGYIRTGQLERSAQRRGISFDQLEADLLTAEDIPLGRIGRADEFADLASFLLSERSSYLTGSGINLDGGLGATV